MTEFPGFFVHNNTWNVLDRDGIGRSMRRADSGLVFKYEARPIPNPINSVYGFRRVCEEQESLNSSVFDRKKLSFEIQIVL